MLSGKKDLFLGIDLGGTKILSAVVDSQGKVLSREYAPTPSGQGPEAGIRAVVGSARRALKVVGIAKSRLKASGIGAAGASNPDTGILSSSPHLPGWKDVPIRELIQRELGVSAYLTNDANAAALGELHYGAGKGFRDLIYITVSTGIGGGIIIDGKLYSGASGAAGELGHMTIDINGQVCSCGNIGCWETLASGTAMAREAKKRIREGKSTRLLKEFQGDINQLTAKEIHRAARDGDKLALELVNQTGYYLGVGLTNLVNIFNPQLIIIGGGLSNMGDLLLEPAIKVVKERAFRAASQSVRFALAQLGEDAGVIGAATFAFMATSPLRFSRSPLRNGVRQSGQGGP